MKNALKCMIGCAAIFASVWAGMYWMAYVITRNVNIYNVWAAFTGSNRRIASSRNAEKGEIEAIDKQYEF